MSVLINIAKSKYRVGSGWKLGTGNWTQHIDVFIAITSHDRKDVANHLQLESVCNCLFKLTFYDREHKHTYIYICARLVIVSGDCVHLHYFKYLQIDRISGHNNAMHIEICIAKLLCINFWSEYTFVFELVHEDVLLIDEENMNVRLWYIVVVSFIINILLSVPYFMFY